MGSEAIRPLQRLAELGQAVWIDYLSRELLTGGGLARLMADDAVVGVTSNPTIFEHAISHGGAYDAQIAELLPRRLTPNALFLELACLDVANACDLLFPVWVRSAGRDGYVSIEVDPNLANEALAQFQQARQLHDRIARPNLLVKIPATQPGVAAIEDSIADGRSINVTLIFSIDRYVEVARAYRDGLVRFRAAGGDLSTVHSVASFFVSRVDTETDRRLEALERSARTERAARNRKREARVRTLPRALLPRGRDLGGSGGVRAQPHSAVCGLRHRPRIRPIATSATSRS